MNIDGFNALQSAEMKQRLLECCHSDCWASDVVAGAPYSSAEALLGACHDRWQTASRAEILEAFSGHPQIGDLSALRNKYAATAGAEQGQVASADESVLIELKAANDRYLERFGFIFIVCATGKSAAEMLALLLERIDNSVAEELLNGAREQAAIMELRIKKLMEIN